MIREKLSKLYVNMIQKTEYYLCKKELSDILKYENFDVEDNKINETKKICIILPSMAKASGGITSILRLGTNLCKQGYDVTYTYVIGGDSSEAQEIAKFNLANYKGEFIPIEKIDRDGYDIVVATWWKTVYEAKKFKGYKMYFVQDYEPIFYDAGDRYLLAKKTYSMGFHMVSLGKWNADMIKKNCNYIGKVDYIPFPYEKTEYQFKQRDFSYLKDKKEIKLAVYVKEENKRLPVVIPLILDNLKNEFEKNGKKLEIFYFGNAMKISVKNGHELGKLSKKQLAELYQTCDFGMVASLTNVSLIPYEMVASGLPLIEFLDGSFGTYFEEGSSIMCDLSYKHLYNEMENYISSPDKISNMVNRAYNQIKDLSWEKSTKKFISIIEQERENGK